MHLIQPVVPSPALELLLLSKSFSFLCKMRVVQSKRQQVVYLQGSILTGSRFQIPLEHNPQGCKSTFGPRLSSPLVWHRNSRKRTWGGNPQHKKKHIPSWSSPNWLLTPAVNLHWPPPLGKFQPHPVTT